MDFKHKPGTGSSNLATDCQNVLLRPRLNPTKKIYIYISMYVQANVFVRMVVQRIEALFCKSLEKAGTMVKGCEKPVFTSPVDFAFHWLITMVNSTAFGPEANQCTFL